jgi:hypothetical protein
MPRRDAPPPVHPTSAPDEEQAILEDRHQAAELEAGGDVDDLGPLDDGEPLDGTEGAP